MKTVSLTPRRETRHPDALERRSRTLSPERNASRLNLCDRAGRAPGNTRDTRARSYVPRFARDSCVRRWSRKATSQCTRSLPISTDGVVRE